MKYYFICSIGPVQDFIANARRSRDLWYGSWILSELSKAVAREINEQSRNSLVFPAPAPGDEISLLPGSSLNSPNKIAAVIDVDPKLLAQNIEIALS